MPVKKLTNKNCTQTKCSNTPVNNIFQALRLNGFLMCKYFNTLEDVEVNGEKYEDKEEEAEGHEGSSIRYQVSGIKYQVSGIMILVMRLLFGINFFL